MPSVLVVFASTTGNTQFVAEQFQLAYGPDSVLFDLSQLDQAAINNATALVCCVSTWGKGDMQDDWDAQHKTLEALDFSGKIVAVLGLGDQKNYPEKFADGAGVLAGILVKRGGKLCGRTNTTGYSFSFSKAVVNGKFEGLIIDEENQHSQTEERIHAWVRQLKREFTRL